MRQVKEFDTSQGKRYRIRYRQGGTQTSETFRTKADAHTFAAILDGGGVTDALEWLAARDRKASTVTFGEWFTDYVAQLTGVTSRTREGYLSIHANHLAGWNDLPLPLLTRSHVTTLVNRLEADGKSPKTIANIVHTLSSALALAIDEGHISKNPTKRVRLPKASIEGGEPIRFLTHDEFGRLAWAMDEFWRPLVVFLVGTGMRWSEATALIARNVNLDAGTVLVRQAWKGRASTELGPPKTIKSRRTVNAATMALGAVAPLLRDPDDWVFLTRLGNIVRHGNFYTRAWLPALERAKFREPPRPHDLRHTHASWLISEGVQLEAVQDQLGHESILTTRKIYGHLLPALGVEVGRVASESLRRALPEGVQLAGGRLSVEAVHDPDELADARGIAAPSSGDRAG